MQTKLWFTQSLNKSQISQFNIGGGAEQQTNNPFLNLTNKTWQDHTDYRAQRRLNKALNRLWFLPAAQRGLAPRSAASRCGALVSRPLHMLGVLVWRVAKEKKTLETPNNNNENNNNHHKEWRDAWTVWRSRPHQARSEMGPRALTMKPCSEAGSYNPSTVRNYIYLNSFPFTCKDTTPVISRTHSFLWSLDGWVLAARIWPGRDLCAYEHTHTKCGGGSWEGGRGRGSLG